MRLDTFSYGPNEEVDFRHLHHWCEIFADYFVPTRDCPLHLLEEVQEYCKRRNQAANDSVCRAYRAGLLP
jgi:hypothetical protein